MKSLLIALTLCSSVSIAQPCFSPGPCDPAPELCLPNGCVAVTYTALDSFIIASAKLPNGYPVIGWSGPCLDEDCPDLAKQAFADLELNAKRANRAQRYE